MKRILALLLVLCLALPLCASAEEKLPRLTFSAANYIGYTGYNLGIQMEVRSSGNFSGTKTLEVRNQHGDVLVTKEFRAGTKQLTFKMAVEAIHEGGHEISVWCDDTQISTNTAFLAITDKHRKAVQTVQTTEPYMSLSFDCAYVDTPTDEILALLEELNIKATFFMTGEFVLTFPESAKKIRDAGHEIGCHSLSHPHLLDYALNMRVKQVRRNVEIIQDTLGVNPRLFRPPFGEFDSTVTATARAEGMEICLWSIDSKDWDWNYKAKDVVKRVTKNVGPGTIILFHLDGYFTPEVVRQVVPYYRDTLGLEMIPITELMAKGGMTLPACPYEDAE